MGIFTVLFNHAPWSDVSPKQLASCLTHGLAASQPPHLIHSSRHRVPVPLAFAGADPPRKGSALSVTAAADVRPDRLSPVVRSRAEFLRHTLAVRKRRNVKLTAGRAGGLQLGGVSKLC